MKKRMETHKSVARKFISYLDNNIVDTYFE